ncbi:MAG: hypothetical protein OXU62_12440 [Gammaproteobacteria bacterium]|nr:hypothetical protein [Gammaproteobacteria bacterium]
MSKSCETIHKLIRGLPKHEFGHSSQEFPAISHEIPSNGISLMYEKGEFGHGEKRIVWVGINEADGRFFDRIKDHFPNEKRESSILRRSIGGALLVRYPGIRDNIENCISKFIKDNISFSVIEVNQCQKRVEIKKQLVGTVAQCKECNPSHDWLGLHSDKDKIVKYGLWQVQHINHAPFNDNDMLRFKEFIENGQRRTGLGKRGNSQ